MFLVYVFTAVAGLVLLVASLFGGGDHEHGEIDGAVEAVDAAADAAHAAGSILSLRFWMYLLTFGGITGVLLRLLAHTGEPMTALISLAVGAVVGLLSKLLFRKLAAPGPTGMVHTDSLVGRSGAVLIPFDRGATGKIRVQINDRTVDLLATTDDPTLSSRDEVLIVEVRDGTTAHVTRSPEQKD
jgi:membrane protein implicated in regulation of membrane protease activity